MTDAAWVRGMGELVLGLARAHETREKADARAQLYRRHLDDLSDEAWLYAVDGVMKTCTFFPTIAELRAAAETWRPESAGYLPPARRTDEERAADAEATRRGLEMVRAAVGEDVGDPVKPMPAAKVERQPREGTVEATEDRLALLRAQAEAIQEAGA
jgi:hypothetical protein